MKRSVRVLALIMALIILFVSPLRVAATGLEGAILGGTTGIALSEPHIAMLILAAFGIAYGWEHREEIGRSYQEGLDRAHQMQLDQLQDDLARREQINAELEAWRESAGLGSIDIATAPAWISDWVKSWANSFIQGDTITINPTNPDGSELVQIGSFVPAGTKISCMDGTYISSDHDAQVVRCRMEYAGKYYYRTCFVYASTDSHDYGKVTIYNSDGTISTNSGTRNTNRLNTHKYYGYVQSNSFYVAESASFNTYFPLQPLNVWELYYSVIDGAYGYQVPAAEISPEVIVGGIANQVSTGTAIDDITVPDIVVPGPDVFPVSPDEGQTTEDTIVKYLTDGLISGQITWDMYWKLLGVLDPTTGTAAPSITVPGAEAGTPSERFELTDNGVASTPVSGMPIGNFMIDLTQFFPFCLPFDVAEFFTILCAEPEAPVFHWEIPVPQLNQTFEIDVDLSAWDDVAYLFRKMELLAFIIGLAIVTREKYIRS